MSSLDVIAQFFDAWGLSDSDQRKSALRSVIGANSTYADPRAPEGLEGFDAISDYVGQFSANAPGWTARVIKSDETNRVARVTVAFGGQGPDGKEKVQLGQYFCRVEGGQITEMTGFVGTGAPE
ncbi:MAG: nuclear transport factor 2 family protein [Arenibacterium sp.]